MYTSFVTINTVQIGVSYLKSRFFPLGDETHLENFFINRFGSRLYETFFKEYTEYIANQKIINSEEHLLWYEMINNLIGNLSKYSDANKKFDSLQKIYKKNSVKKIYVDECIFNNWL